LGANILGSRNPSKKISILFWSASLFAFFSSSLIRNLGTKELLGICMLNFAADSMFYMSQEFSPQLNSKGHWPFVLVARNFQLILYLSQEGYSKLS
jgi:hypothetical protein